MNKPDLSSQQRETSRWINISDWSPPSLSTWFSQPAKQHQNGSQPTESFPFHKEDMQQGPHRRTSGWIGILWFSTFLASLALLALLVIEPNRPRIAQSKRKHLRTPVASPKLKDDDKQKPVLLVHNEPADVVPPLPDPIYVPPPAAPAVVEVPSIPPPLPEVPVIPEPPPATPLIVPPPLPQVEEPVVSEMIQPQEQPLDPPFLALDQRGDTPMLRNWKMLTLLAATIVYLEPPQVVAQADDADIKAILQRMDKMDTALQGSFKAITDQITELKKDTTKLKDSSKTLTDNLATLSGETLKQQLNLDKTNKRLDIVDEQLKLLRADLDGLKFKVPQTPVASGVDKASMDEIRGKLSQIEQALAKIESTNRVSLSPPRVGRVVLVNLYHEDLLFVINSQTHRVPPNSTMPLDSIPAGQLTYEVIPGTWGLRANNTVSLSANETFTLTAR